ncbi:MAG: hypothetical protein JNL72_02590 [Flavipsychrobacter sp.]|nr:hypothetical protein [Flavipsychrobacter sp.]
MKSGTLIPLLISSTVLITLFAVYFILFFITYRNKQRKNLLEKQRLRHEYESELLNSKLEMQEEALNRVSMEIHDSICQNLGAVKHKLLRISETEQTPSPSLAAATELLAENIHQLRNISHSLNTNHIQETGLLCAIEEEINFRRSLHDVIFRLNINGDEKPIHPEAQLLLFRIVQESLSNSIRHGKATEIDINVLSLPTHIEMTIKDNGRGFDTTRLEGKKGIGLSNMKQRVQLMKGTFTLETAPGNGTNIYINIEHTKQQS